jgi:hypothetical protein
MKAVHDGNLEVRMAVVNALGRIKDVRAARRAAPGAHASRAAGRGAATRPRVSVENFQSDPLFPRIERAVAAILATGVKVVAPVDVLVTMDILAPKDVDAWRSGRVHYLERVILGNLTRLSRLLRILGFHCHDLKLVATPATYVRSGKGPRTLLRFTKTGEPRLEKVYARHFVWPGKVPFHPPGEKRAPRIYPRPREASAAPESGPTRTRSPDSGL